MEGGGTVVAAEQVASFSAAVAGVVVGRAPCSPAAPLQLPAALLTFFRLRRREQGLDLLQNGAQSFIKAFVRV